MTYEEYKLEITQLNEKMRAASKALQEFPKGEMGLTPDHVRKSPEFIKAKDLYERLFSMVRKCNSEAPKSYKLKLRKERGRI